MTLWQWTLIILLAPPAVVTMYYGVRAALVWMAMKSGGGFQ